MPRMRRLQSVETVSQTFKIPMELMQHVDTYKALTGAESRNAVINTIIAHYFSNSAGISPAMQNILRTIIPSIPIPENAEELLALLMSDATDADVATAFLTAMHGLFTHQISVMRSALKQPDELPNE